MIVRIILEDTKKDYDQMYEKIGDPTHVSLAGNKDYVDSNIVLNLDPGAIKDGKQLAAECTLYMSGDDITDKELIRIKAKELIDRFVNNL